jgi:hypothetical protein
MGKVEDTLVKPLEKGTPHFIEENRQNDGDRKPKNKGIHVKEQGIFKDLEKVRRPEKPAELLQAYPSASGNAQTDLEILEGDNGAVHGHIFKNKVIGQRQDQKNVKPVIPADIFGKLEKICFLFNVHEPPFKIGHARTVL